MAQYQFAGCLYRNVRELCDAIAEAHLSAGGCNSNEAIRGFLAEETDAELTAECIKCWFSEAGAEECETVDEMEFESADLEAAFRRLRDPKNFAEAFGEDDAA